MEKSIKQTILESFSNIYEEAKGCKLQHEALDKLETELSIVSNYFTINRMQSFFTSVIFAMNYGGNFVDMNDFVHYLDCNPIKLLEHKSELDELCNRGIIEKVKLRHHRMQLEGSNEQYMVNKKVTEAILQSKPFPTISKETVKDVVELMEEMSTLWNQRVDEEITSLDMYEQMGAYMKDYESFPLIKTIKDLQLSTADECLLLSLIWRTVCGRESSDLSSMTDMLFESRSAKFSFQQELINGENVLMKEGLMELAEANFFSDTEIKLASKAKDMLNSCGLKLFSEKKKRDNIIYSEDIKEKLLIFNEGEMKQLELLRGLLTEERLNETQTRLDAKGLPKGINVLLHGAPGTGKTETVLQLAKATGREIMKVEISQSKSMWFGESEKIIKRIFTDYKTLLKESKRTPILFFNEADAIISKRRNIGNSSVSQTENAIQNIILEELENFEGILIATTNLANNMDTAFERRFLFKVEFQKPQIETKIKIWLEKLPNLNLMEAELLAKKYDFSGAQIENIVRKQEIYEILNGGDFNITLIQGFCEEEQLVKQTKIGF
jgi:SpoVK/Ycf46/Vps4 family AAA+-type ATPase